MQDMAASSLIPWLTFKRERGIFHCYLDALDNVLNQQFRQMNMDYVVCQAAAYRTGNKDRKLDLLVIYDIICQWAVYFMKRVNHGKMLSFSQFQALLRAIGKFHLAAHKEECYFAHSLNYMKGVGQIDGEIMETLWAAFNKFAGMARVMSVAHRKEILNDHMRDVNWKKMVGMGMFT